MVSSAQNLCDNNKVHNGSTGTHASQLRQRPTLPQASVHSMTSNLWCTLAQSFCISEETRSTSQKLPACLHKNNKQNFHIYQYRKYSKLFLSLFDNPLRKELQNEARQRLAVAVWFNTFSNQIMGKDASSLKTKELRSYSFSRFYRDIERKQSTTMKSATKANSSEII